MGTIALLPNKLGLLAMPSTHKQFNSFLSSANVHQVSGKKNRTKSMVQCEKCMQYIPLRQSIPTRRIKVTCSDGEHPSPYPAYVSEGNTKFSPETPIWAVEALQRAKGQLSECDVDTLSAMSSTPDKESLVKQDMPVGGKEGDVFNIPDVDADGEDYIEDEPAFEIPSHRTWLSQEEKIEVRARCNPKEWNFGQDATPDRSMDPDLFPPELAHIIPDDTILSEDDPRFYPSIEDQDLKCVENHRFGFVAVVGTTNCGKSTFLNAILKQRLSIVTPKAQTTRHQIRGIISEDQAQLVFVDTPGILKKSQNVLDTKMMMNVKEAVNDSDVLLILIDVSYDPVGSLAAFQPPKQWKGPPVAVVLNKCDLLQPQEVQQAVNWFKTKCNCSKVFACSALSGDGLAAIKDWCIKQCPLGPPMYPKDYSSDESLRFFVSEIVREQIFAHYTSNIPYCTTVRVIHYIEMDSGRTLITCHVICDDKSQVPILLGKGGVALRVLTTAARTSIEQWLGNPVKLLIKIKLADDWRRRMDGLIIESAA